LEELAFLDSFSGAVVSASTAADTNISIDNVLVFALGDRFDGAVVSASAALDASISDIVSHDFPSIYMFSRTANKLCISILAWISEKAIPFLASPVYFFQPLVKIIG
jgi:hypothetical protein